MPAQRPEFLIAHNTDTLPFKPVPTETYGRGRVCADQRCGTVLSVYNPDRYCSLCMRYHRRRLIAEEAAAYMRDYERDHRALESAQ